MGDVEPGPLHYAKPGLPRPGRPALRLGERIAVCLVLSVIGCCIGYVGLCCVAEAGKMVPGYGEHERLIHVGWGLVAVGCVVCLLGLWNLKRWPR